MFSWRDFENRISFLRNVFTEFSNEQTVFNFRHRHILLPASKRFQSSRDIEFFVDLKKMVGRPLSENYCVDEESTIAPSEKSSGKLHTFHDTDIRYNEGLIFQRMVVVNRSRCYRWCIVGNV